MLLFNVQGHTYVELFEVPHLNLKKIIPDVVWHFFRWEGWLDEVDIDFIKGIGKGARKVFRPIIVYEYISLGTSNSWLAAAYKENW